MPSKIMWSFLITLFFCFSCTSKKEDANQPSTVLTKYITTSFAIKSFDEKEKLIQMTTGEVKDLLTKLSEEEFKKYFIDSARQFISMKIKDQRAIGDSEYSITYELSYNSKSKESEAVITNKKHALFKLENGKWLISEVKNLKTFIDHKNELSF